MASAEGGQPGTKMSTGTTLWIGTTRANRAGTPTVGVWGCRSTVSR